MNNLIPIELINPTLITLDNLIRKSESTVETDRLLRIRSFVKFGEYPTLQDLDWLTELTLDRNKKEHKPKKDEIKPKRKRKRIFK